MDSELNPKQSVLIIQNNAENTKAKNKTSEVIKSVITKTKKKINSDSDNASSYQIKSESESESDSNLVKQKKKKLIKKNLKKKKKVLLFIQKTLDINHWKMVLLILAIIHLIIWKLNFLS